MTHRLILIRHAKSSWDSDGADDHDRPLTKRGRRSAVAIGSWLKAHEICPDEVITSTAERAVQTWRGIRTHMKCKPEVRREAALYHADLPGILGVLRSARGRNVLMIGHNPGFAMFAAGICRLPSEHPDFNRYPTCATALMDFDIASWSHAAAGLGEVADFIVPRQLLG